MVGGWMQGARFIGSAVLSLKDSSNTPHPSYCLREPKLVEWLQAKLKVVKTTTDRQKSIISTIQKELASIGHIINISIDPKKGRIGEGDMQTLIKGATAIVNAAVAK
jgi:hypothetical protein